MPSFTRRITIARSPEQVFAVLDDLEAAPRWMPSIRRIEVLTPGMPMGAGFKWRETRRVFGILRFKVVLTVVQHHRPSTWGVMFNDGKVQATATFELSPTGAGTEVVFTEEVEDLRGQPGRAERMARMMEKQDADLLPRLKAHVESTTEPPARPRPAARKEEELEQIAAEAAEASESLAEPRAKPAAKRAPKKAAAKPKAADTGRGKAKAPAKKAK